MARVRLVDQNGHFVQAKMDQSGPFGLENPVRNKVILTKMAVWTILDHFGPAFFPTVPRPLPVWNYKCIDLRRDGKQWGQLSLAIQENVQEKHPKEANVTCQNLPRK